LAIKYYTKTNRKNDYIKGLKFILIFALLIIVVSSSIFLVFFIKGEIEKSYADKELRYSYKKVFDKGDWADLINKMNAELVNNPYVADYLIYRGYSLFMLGEHEKGMEKKMDFFRLALIDLRKALAIGVDTKNIADLYFCIGKIYFYMGPDY
jgi:tetratricopeptide (TPR) repeat protein